MTQPQICDTVRQIRRSIAKMLWIARRMKREARP